MPRKRRDTPPGILWDSLYPTLDLHGDSATEARRRAERWLREQRSAGEPVVRLITGRGLHSAGPPVLPNEIDDLLRSLRPTLVRDFEREPGGGVVRIRLRPGGADRLPTEGSSRKGEPVPPIGDPALRRRAEEALADLGITPTPELLRAEMQRLKREGED